MKSQVSSILRKTSMHKRRFKALVLSIALMPFCRQVSLNELARQSQRIFGGKVIHQLKRFYRLFSNAHLQIDPLWAAYLKEVFTVTLCALKDIPLILDWCDLKKAKLLRLSLAFMGRSLPLYQRAIPLNEDKEMVFDKVKLNGKEIRSQSQFEIEFLKEFFAHLLSFSHLLSGKRLILVGDRGFGYGEFLVLLQQLSKLKKSLRLDFVIRIKADVFVQLSLPLPPNLSIDKDKLSKNSLVKGDYALLPAGALRIKANQSAFIPHILYRQDHILKCHFALAHKSLVGKTQEESTWRLVTSLEDPNRALGLFALRMEIEEGFKDSKGAHEGLQIKSLRFKSLDRMDRFLFCLTVATFCLLLIGLHVQRNPHWAEQIATRNPRTHTGFSLSVFALARKAICNLKEPLYSFSYRKLYILRV